MVELSSLDNADPPMSTKPECDEIEEKIVDVEIVASAVIYFEFPLDPAAPVGRIDMPWRENKSAIETHSLPCFVSRVTLS